MSDTRAYILEDLSKLESKELTLVYKYIRRHLIADIQGLKDPLKEPSLLSTALKTIEAKDKQIQLYREGIEDIKRMSTVTPLVLREDIEDKCIDLLSSPVDKSTVSVSKEAVVFGGTGLCNKCGQLSFNCICKDKEWSDWYEYKHELNFNQGVVVEWQTEKQGLKDNRYRIKLDGVKVITDPGFSSIQTIHSVRGYLGNDLHNKIIIISTINQKE